MNKIKINIDYSKKIITIDILGKINNNTICGYNNEIDNELKKIIELHDVNLNGWRFNIYTCHMIIYKEDMKHFKSLLDYTLNLNFKMLDIITAIPQKLYKSWITNLINKNFNDRHIKVLSTNKIFKFKIN